MGAEDLFTYALQIIPFGVVIAVAIGLIAILFGLYLNPYVAVAAVIGFTVWQAAAYELDPLFELGIFIYADDIVFVCIGLAALLRIAFAPGAFQRVPGSLILLLSVMATSFAIGFAHYGTKAGVEFRGDFYVWMGCLYVVTFPPEKAWLDRLLSWWIFLALLLCIIVWYRWTADAFDLTWFEPIWRTADPTGVAFQRVAPANVAFALGLVVLVLIATIASGRASGMHFLLMPAILLTIVALQHRSVWVATVLSMMLLLLRLHSAKRQSAKVPLVITVASIVVIAAIGVFGSGALGDVESSVIDQAVRATSTTSGTFVSRVEGWGILLGQWADSGPVGFAIGQPYGSGFERYQKGFFDAVEIGYSPHNYFVSILLRTGLIGLAALVWLFWGLLRVGLMRIETSERFGPPLVVAITTFVILFSIPYTPTTDSGFLLGAVISYAYAIRRELTHSAALAVESPPTAQGQTDDEHPAVPDLPPMRHRKLL